LKDFSPRAAAVWFWSVTVFFAALWVILPSLFHTAYRMTDVIELQCIAKEWVLSTRKHPMLPAWILEIVNILTNRAFVAPFLASQICVIISLWSVWQLGRKVLSEKLALIGTLAVLPYYFFAYHSLVYNQNTVLIAFWSLSVYLVFQAFQTNRLFYWILSGLSIGLAFHAKYPAAFLVLSMLIFMFTRPEGRKRWCGTGPYLTTIIAFLIFLPHVIWLYQNDFSTLVYAGHRYPYSNPVFRVLMPLLFIISQGEYWFPVLVVLYPVLGFVWKWKVTDIGNTDDSADRSPFSIDREKLLQKEKRKQCEKYLFYCFMIPFLLCVSISFIENCEISASYAAPFWTFSGVWAILRFRAKELPDAFFRIIRLVVLLEFGMCLLLVVNSCLPYLTGKPKRQLFPMREFGIACDRIWSSQFDGPCPYVTGDWSLCGYAIWAMKDRPSLHYYWNIYDGGIHDSNATPTGTWSTDADVNQKGGIIVWEVKDSTQKEIPKYVRDRFPKAEVLPDPIILPYKTKADVPPVKVGIAIIPPPEQ
ncbi:MAG: glycosyltransferase family 39 protein, partial [Planctomycetaceae bacterium]|nr:glycosyltransferase family 39 protein [Planctomycetaceae bacterium]